MTMLRRIVELITAIANLSPEQREAMGTELLGPGQRPETEWGESE